MDEKILTVPDKVVDYKPYYLTGNEYVSIPLIDPEDGGIGQVNILSMEKRGLISFNGKKSPLFKPFMESEGKRINIKGSLRWAMHKNWIPEFTYEDKDYIFNGTISAPIGIKGFLFVLRVLNKTGESKKISIGIEGSFEISEHTVFHNRLINCLNSVSFSRWTNSLVFEIKPDTAIAAISCGADETLDIIEWNEDGAYNPANIEVCTQNDGTNSILSRQAKLYDIEPHGEKVAAFYFGLNMEADGASTTMVDMKRRGFKKLMCDTLNWIDAHTVSIDHELSDVMNRNLLFNYFYSTGNSIDTEETVPVTSRSPRYYVSAAFWSRDTFLWSFPGILIVDKKRARDILTSCFKKYLKNAGIHSLYINGSVLYPGFELDELCAFVIGLKYYVEITGDHSIIKDRYLKEGLKHILKVLFEYKDSDEVMFKTFLDPSDDPVKYDYLIYDNVLVYAALEFLERLSREYGLSLAENYNLDAILKELKKSILEHGTFEINGSRMFAWSTDLKGNKEIYDDPPGSLQLLNYYGFIEKHCEIFTNTIDYIYSSQNPYYSKGSRISGVGCLHAENPWPMAAAASMLCGNIDKGVEFFINASMDNGFACETVDPDTGISSTGLAFATCGGFIGSCLYKVLYKDKNN